MKIKTLTDAERKVVEQSLWARGELSFLFSYTLLCSGTSELVSLIAVALSLIHI